MPIAVAVIGLGKIAHDQHLPAIAASDRFVLAATVDPAAEETGSPPHFTNLADLLASGCKVDAVVVCTPPRVRQKLAREALKAGLHVMLEKPPCATVEEAEELRDLAARGGVTLYTAWHSQHAAGVAPARKWLAGRTIRSVAIDWREDVRVWHPGQKWIFEECGFGVFDPAINALSILTALVPGPLRVESALLEVPANCAAPIAGRLAMTDTAATPIALEMDFLQTGPQTWDIRIETDAGTLLLQKGGSVLVTPEGIRTASDGEYPSLYARFAELIGSVESEVDLAPLELVESALLQGERREVAPFHE
ncbi:MAG: Gfo/Idh/MocA family oxidoreductase [Erythrobacter sp.]|nr:MAG: Gfo/Idh/MocA family oxidoreductase [Erythrobacter sp.]